MRDLILQLSKSSIYSTKPLGRALPRPEIYLEYDIARDICHFLFGSVNADTMYDTFFYISLIIVIFLSAVLYIITLQLISTIRSK
ncbi:hypothetical protein [Klebsiella pneumoniae]|uniref:hypothetical protein n=1 Tax=Klebsiella pneumoniae TaxID=573 RepID=UPI001F406A33|nr:hypothetical protein [Klebsiella pneumoniae]